MANGSDGQTLLFWSGQMLEASSLLGQALRIAQRLGIHRDGSIFNLPPWQVELRRRLWYHILLLDLWCSENCGVESMISLGYQDDVPPPQNSDDASWDTSEFSMVRPEADTGFTDMSTALVQYEIAATAKAILNHIPMTDATTDINRYLSFHSQLLENARKKINTQYLTHLDLNEPRQRLISDLVTLALDRLRLAQLQSAMSLPNMLPDMNAMTHFESEYVSQPSSQPPVFS
jgi:hypothetical protein